MENKDLTKIIIKIDRNTKEVFKKLAKEEDLDISKLTRKLIKQYIKENADKLNKLF